MNSLKKKMDGMPDEIASKGWFLLENVFEPIELGLLDTAFLSKIPNLSCASIGQGKEKKVNLNVRGDQNLWLSEADNSFSPIWQVLNLVQSSAKMNLFLPLKRFEAQMALYPPGAFYARHKDQHQENSSRSLSLVFYFSEWQPENGGELVIYSKEGMPQKVSPQRNHLIIFRSDLEHEVLPTKTTRKSVSAWMRTDLF